MLSSCYKASAFYSNRSETKTRFRFDINILLVIFKSRVATSPLQLQLPCLNEYRQSRLLARARISSSNKICSDSVPVYFPPLSLFLLATLPIPTK